MGLDKLLSEALEEAAASVQADIDRFGMFEMLEPDLRTALRRALHGRLPGVIRIERGFAVTGWTGRVGGVDLVAESDGAAAHALEIKFARSLAGVLWDLLKLASPSVDVACELCCRRPSGDGDRLVLAPL
jgi:hypothetical protein